MAALGTAEVPTLVRVGLTIFGAREAIFVRDPLLEAATGNLRDFGIDLEMMFYETLDEKTPFLPLVAALTMMGTAMAPAVFSYSSVMPRLSIF